MLMSNEFVRAEDKYRRELLQDQRQKSKSSRVGTTVTALVVAGALALAACGVPQEADGGAIKVTTHGPSSILRDPGPPWQPNLDALPRASAVAPAIEFGGMPAPTWQPNQKLIEEIFPTPDTGVAGDSEPNGHPNYGRLATYLGGEPASGPR